ncbi:MAG: NADH-quinone oxidoreductase subunit L [Syntrophales bacterium]
MELLWLIPAFPFAGFVLLVLAADRLSRKWIPLIGAGSVGISAILSVYIVSLFILTRPGEAYCLKLWTWMQISGFSPPVSLYLDELSAVMMIVVAVVSFLIHVYSAEFMAEEEGYSRFFAYMNLFVGFMLTLVLAENLLLLYLGWEGVGLCSYLLIGFWYKDRKNVLAANKAFIVTRVGDAAMAIGLLLLFTQLGSLDIQEMMRRASHDWRPGSPVAVASAALLLGGAVGKSAQLPLQVWLPDAMAGPTPVSALIHAATMVTAGVYLIARTYLLFTIAPAVQSLVAAIGAATLLIAGFSALTQWDIKRVLAYSTISQIGYMFLALGVGAWVAAVFHFMTHAFFKALLFLGAGVVIQGLGEEHDMYKMGGLRTQLPLTFWTFLIGAASLSALPFVTAGFYSKDLILFFSWSSGKGSPWLWAAGLMGSLITGIYAFRMVFLTFFGKAKGTIGKRPGMSIKIPLIILAVLSVIGGFLQMPDETGPALFSDFMHGALPAVATISVSSAAQEIRFACAMAAPLIGILLAWVFFLGKPAAVRSLVESRAGEILRRFWFSGWGFDLMYDVFFLRTFLRIARVNAGDFMDIAFQGPAVLSRILNAVLVPTQSGKIRWYAAGITLGAVVMMWIVLLV